MKEPRAHSTLYDWSMAVASLWCSGGILLDAWYHFHETVETFFEPAHALLYAGLLASFLFTGIAAWKLRRLPPGYDATAAGLIVFLIGGILDMIKHTLWGFEQGFDALLSVTHLIIGAGMFLIIAGPIRAAYLRARPPQTLIAQLPAILALGSMMELVHWGTQFVFLSEAERMNAPLNPAHFPHDTFTLLSLLYYKEGIGLLAVIVQSLLLASAACFLLRRLTLAPGALTVLFFSGDLFIALAHSNYLGQFLAVVTASIAAGVAGDLLKARVKVAAAAMPAVYWAVMLVILAATMNGLWWSPDVISGSVVIAGASGLLIAILTEQSPSPKGAGL